MREWMPHVVILDLELPGKSGVAIMQEMLQDPQLSDTILIANTSHMKSDDNLGFAYFYQYEKLKKEEAVMLDKSNTNGHHINDLRYAVANLVAAKYGKIPQPLADWIKKNPPSRQ
jgi:CheY-like chemotaxis protein